MLNMAAATQSQRNWLCLAPLLLACSGAPVASDIRVDPLPVRDFGYTIGDRITREFQVTLPARRQLEQESLPAPGPVDEWLELTDADWQPTTTPNIFRLQVEYQVFKGVRSPEAVRVPPVSLHLRGEPAGGIAIPTWAFTLQPLIPAGTADSEVVLRPPAGVNPPDPSWHWRRVTLYLVGIVLLLASRAWLDWLKRRAERPFALALARIRTQSRRQTGSGSDPRAAMQHVHRALDATAGHRLFANQLPAFLAEHSAYSALHDDLTRFFELSERLFFAAPAAGLPDGMPTNWIADLCRRCADIEAGKT